MNDDQNMMLYCHNGENLVGEMNETWFSLNNHKGSCQFIQGNKGKLPCTKRIIHSQIIIPGGFSAKIDGRTIPSAINSELYLIN